MDIVRSVHTEKYGILRQRTVSVMKIHIESMVYVQSVKSTKHIILWIKLVSAVMDGIETIKEYVNDAIQVVDDARDLKQTSVFNAQTSVILSRKDSVSGTLLAQRELIC